MSEKTDLKIRTHSFGEFPCITDYKPKTEKQIFRVDFFIIMHIIFDNWRRREITECGFVCVCVFFLLVVSDDLSAISWNNVVTRKTKS